MKKLLVRAGMTPYDVVEPGKIILDNLVGDNTGNLIYQYGIFRALTTENQELVPNGYRYVGEKYADEINQNYAGYVMPFADVLRPDMKKFFERITRLIRKLKVPVVVVGIGLRAPFHEDLKHGFSFDAEAKAFLKVVLDHSAIIGVRGEITGAYLKSLGFREEIDYTVIGCPSMYTFGKDIKVRNLDLQQTSRICVNASVVAPNKVNLFLRKAMREIPDHYFLPQRLLEMKMVFAGEPYVHQQKHAEDYPNDMLDSLYKENRVRCFGNAVSWFEFLRNSDFSIGGRMHGNIAAILSGTPALLIPHDARMKELTEFHHIPHIWAKDLKPDADIFEIANNMDFRSILKDHDKHFEAYVKFLEKNGLEHIFKDGNNPEISPLDQKIKEAHVPYSEIDTVYGHTAEERFLRTQSFYVAREAMENELKDMIDKTKIELAHRNNLLKSKPVNYAVKIRELLGKSTGVPFSE